MQCPGVARWWLHAAVCGRVTWRVWLWVAAWRRVRCGPACWAVMVRGRVRVGRVGHDLFPP